MTPDKQAELDAQVDQIVSGKPDRFGHRVLGLQFGNTAYTREERSYLTGQAAAKGLKVTTTDRGCTIERSSRKHPA